ncbi:MULTISPECIES: DUF4190 domain-containing protein [unclassified Modicisalibacter]|uniref:DUF4190 domain-containing protein n=1 Tax=unclassified Modicisalibacter TaxID=2679913 RepID=UPI001CCD85D0|nr:MULTISPECIES: DUF4190 domain-containing protein [unclassified Modicisalibacter]MBZ9560315.1 hypothetical protein [Modicisalibacter sp. R2A 31.J]MBZ9576224.1 hypothetical protein [Modicisalibacter sp. MOD 31.J]
MDGDIIAFDDTTQAGVIETPKGQRFTFGLPEWRGRGLPGPGIAVRFDVREARAVQVMNRPEPQQRARPRASVPAAGASTTPTSAPRYAHPAVVAVGVAILGLFFDRLAPAFALVAGLSALLGLWQIRRAPRRYKGRGLCWGALTLAIVVAALSLLVEAPTAAPGRPVSFDQSQTHVVPGASPG